MHVDWESPATFPKLERHEVQVWRINLDEVSTDEKDYLHVLGEEEVQRASRMRAGEVRMQFVVGRSSLRRLLGAELNLAPEEILFAAGPYGKPELASGKSKRIHFNVAHSRSTVLIAVSLSGKVGIDLEYLDRKTDVAEVGRHSFTANEATAILAMDSVEKRSKAFFESWTRKEALVKADGRGLSLPFTTFEVPPGAMSQPLCLEVPSEDGLSCLRYFLRDVALGEGVSCALATDHAVRQIRLLRFPSCDSVQTA